MKEKLIINIQESIDLLKKYSNNMIRKIGIGSLSSTTVNATITIILAFGVIKGKLKLGDFIALSSGASQLIARITQMVSIFPDLYEHSIYIDNFNQFINYKPKIKNKMNAILFPDNYTIKFNNVSFKYLNNSEYAIKNMCIEIKKGEKIALVGRNGSGKSTIIKLLCRLYDPTNGNLEINGLSYTDYDLESIRDKIGIVFQDQQIFSISIAENVLMRPIENINDDAEIVISSLKAVGLYEKVMSLDKGMLTVMSREFEEDGAIFSGGELQRLLIARMYAKGKSLLILDEPSNSLDIFAEKELYDMLLKDKEVKSVVFVTHHLSNIQNVDKIYFIEDGFIKEFGTHTSLMNLKKSYYEMYNMQARGYI